MQISFTQWRKLHISEAKNGSPSGSTEREKGDNTGAAEYVNKRLTLDRIDTRFACDAYVSAAFSRIRSRMDITKYFRKQPKVCNVLLISRYLPTGGCSSPFGGGGKRQLSQRSVRISTIGGRGGCCEHFPTQFFSCNSPKCFFKRQLAHTSEKAQF